MKYVTLIILILLCACQPPDRAPAGQTYVRDPGPYQCIVSEHAYDYKVYTEDDYKSVVIATLQPGDVITVHAIGPVIVGMSQIETADGRRGYAVTNGVCAP
jgi:hypothetical protein